MSLEVAASNGVHSTISAPLAFVPVTLPVPLGRSLYTRLSQLADAEGLDLVTLAVQLLAYQAGVSSMRGTRAGNGQPSTGSSSPPPERPDLAARHAVVCIMCGRERIDQQQTRCDHCGGKWVATSA